MMVEMVCKPLLLIANCERLKTNTTSWWLWLFCGEREREVSIHFLGFRDKNGMS